MLKLDRASFVSSVFKCYVRVVIVFVFEWASNKCSLFLVMHKKINPFYPVWSPTPPRFQIFRSGEDWNDDSEPDE